MDITITSWGGIEFTPKCHEPDGSICRVTCAADDPCETYTEDHECGLKPIDGCNGVDWLDAIGPQDCYGGGRDNVPIHDGMPIVIEWEGDGWEWRRAPESAGGAR
jgi:hypothetical protein